jgi:hypothetical protein
MHIHPTHARPISPESVQLPQPADLLERSQVGLVAPTPDAADRRHDVEVCSDGRTLSPRGRPSDSMGMDPGRVQRIRGRILSGAYDTLKVVDAVARRLLDADDL